MPATSTRKSRRGLILRLLGTAIAFGVVAFLVWQNWADFIAALRSLPMPYLLAAFGLAMVSRLSVSLRWYVLLRAVNPDVRIGEIIKLSFVGLFSSNVLPSTIGGDVVRLAGGVQAGLDSALVTASLVMDRLVGLSTMATFLPFGLWRIAGQDARTMSGPDALAAVGLGGFVGKLWRKLRAFLIKTFDSLRQWFKHPAGLGIAALLSYVHMACTFSMVFLILMGLSDPVSWWTAGGLWVLIYFITLIPVSINGLGLQEASLSLLFSTLGGVSESNSLVLALLMRVIFIVASLPGAVFLPGVMSGKPGQDPEESMGDVTHVG
jgi:hypothetical protein